MHGYIKFSKIDSLPIPPFFFFKFFCTISVLVRFFHLILFPTASTLERRWYCSPFPFFPRYILPQQPWLLLLLFTTWYSSLTDLINSPPPDWTLTPLHQWLTNLGSVPIIETAALFYSNLITSGRPWVPPRQRRISGGTWGHTCSKLAIRQFNCRKYFSGSVILVFGSVILVFRSVIWFSGA